MEWNLYVQCAIDQDLIQFIKFRFFQEVTIFKECRKWEQRGKQGNYHFYKFPFGFRSEIDLPYAVYDEKQCIMNAYYFIVKSHVKFILK